MHALQICLRCSSIFLSGVTSSIWSQPMLFLACLQFDMGLICFRILLPLPFVGCTIITTLTFQTIPPPWMGSTIGNAAHVMSPDTTDHVLRTIKHNATRATHLAPLCCQNECDRCWHIAPWLGAWQGHISRPHLVYERCSMPLLSEMQVVLIPNLCCQSLRHHMACNTCHAAHA